MRRTLNLGLFAATVAAWLFVVFSAQSFNSADRDLKVAKADAFDSIVALWQSRSLAYSANGDLSRAALDPANAAQHQKSFHDKEDRIRRYIGNELNNITFPGEREAAEELEARHKAFANDRKALGSFDAALARALRINQDEFEQAIERGFRDVANFETIAPAFTFAICALAWLGLRPRLREYSV
jgi:phosphoglycolate phosphatase-like HAD superfamily hydrolase